MIIKIENEFENKSGTSAVWGTFRHMMEKTGENRIKKEKSEHVRRLLRTGCDVRRGSCFQSSEKRQWCVAENFLRITKLDQFLSKTKITSDPWSTPFKVFIPVRPVMSDV